jgi:hypothetical protein
MAPRHARQPTEGSRQDAARARACRGAFGGFGVPFVREILDASAVGPERGNTVLGDARCAKCFEDFRSLRLAGCHAKDGVLDHTVAFPSTNNSQRREGHWGLRPTSGVDHLSVVRNSTRSRRSRLLRIWRNSSGMPDSPRSRVLISAFRIFTRPSSGELISISAGVSVFSVPA